MLSFLVLAQGYELAATLPVDPATTAGVALAVGVVATGLSYGVAGWLGARSA